MHEKYKYNICIYIAVALKMDDNVMRKYVECIGSGCIRFNAV